MPTKAIYPGSFDPVTNGHTALIAQAAQLYDELIIAVAINAAKSSNFSIEDRVKMLELVYANHSNITITSFTGLTVEFAREHDANVILRGLRLSADFEYEFQLAGMNHDLDPGIHTVFLPAMDGYSHISSSMVREVMRLGGDVTKFVPAEILAIIQPS